MTRLAAVVVLCALTSPVLAQPDASYREPFTPFRIVGNVYYVGTHGLASFLIVTPAGDILLDTGLASSAPLLRASIEQLGFQLADVKIMLDGHAHFDHVGTHAEMQRLTRAQVMVMDADAAAMSSGRDLSALGSGGWPPVAVDRVLKDGDTVSLGGTTLTAHRTPGHTSGCTTWTMAAHDDAADYSVVFACSLTVVAEHLRSQPRQPAMVDDYRRTFAYLSSLNPDVWLTEHGEFFDLEGKYKKLQSAAGPNPFIDPAGYRSFLSRMEAAYKERLAAE